MKPGVPLAVAAVCLLAVAGCGPVGGGGDVTGEPRPGSGGAKRGGTELTVTVTRGPRTGERTYSLTCDPPGGSHPDPEAACRLLGEMKDPLASVPRDAMCTQVYGGPQTARVAGTLRGEPVDARFSRTDGCEIARWDEHAALLVETGGVERG